MSNATWAVPSFLGGEISAFAQGRFDKPDYKVSLNVCLNWLPVEVGALTRRPGSHHAGHTRGGGPGRTIKFDFQQSNAVTMEFTDGYLRARNGASLIATNDAVAVTAVSAANPAVVQTSSAVTWSTGNTLMFPGASTPLLENRQFVATKIDTTRFALADALTGANIDGATLGALAAGATVRRVQELVTPYIGGSWASIRSVQAETTSILLAPSVAPQALTVTSLPAPGVDPLFAISPAVFNDGPYLDPFINGVQATPGAKSGIVTLSLSFPAYDATKAYAAGAFVTSSSINYISLLDQNVNNTPASSPTFWAVTSASAAINGGRGFLGSDIGRLVRLFSEPPLWSAASTYAASTAAAPVIVSYNPSGVPGATVYYQAVVSSTAKVPGTDLDNWKIITQAAIWTWGKIATLSNIISPTLSGSTNIGDMTGGGGIAAAFNGIFGQAASASAEKILTTPSTFVLTLASYVGKNYSGASDQVVQQVTVYPSADSGFYSNSGDKFFVSATLKFNLRGKASAPSSSSDGTLLGSLTTANSFSAVTITSSDQTTAWKYVWIEVISTSILSSAGPTFTVRNIVGQMSIFNPPGTGISSGINVQVLGPALLYTAPIATWRLGVFSGTTGYPTCGTYHESRLWVGGAIANRFDACKSNGIVGGTVDFAPTDQNGVVAPNAAISYVLNSDGVNPMFWMKPDLQGVVIGTQQGEWLVQAPTTGPIAPANIAARRMTKNGSANIEPARTENASLFVKRYARKLLEYFSDAYSGKYSAPNLADKAGHLVSAGLAELAYVEAVTPIVWMRDAAGALIGMTYRRTTISTQQPPDFYAWHRHALGSGRTVESICAGPSVGGDLDALTMVTNDPANSIRHVEVLTDTPDENTPLANAWFLDAAVTPSSTTDNGTGLTINGLWHLNGKTVQVFAGGLDLGDRGDNKTTFTDFVVSNGSVTIPYGDSISSGPGRGLFTAAFVATGIQIVVGFTYNSDGQLVRPIAAAETGSRSGPALGLIRRNHRFAALLNSTRGISIGGSFDQTLYPVKLTNARGDAIPTLSAFSGIAEEPVNDAFSYDGGLCWRVSRPFPANIVAISGNIRAQDQ